MANSADRALRERENCGVTATHQNRAAHDERHVDFGPCLGFAHRAAGVNGIPKLISHSDAREILSRDIERVLVAAQYIVLEPQEGRALRLVVNASFIVSKS